jgi:hypothetical protein
MLDASSDGRLCDVSDLQQLVFIDSRVPDLHGLINGLASGAQAFVLEPLSDGVQQIADALAASGLTHLTATSIVGHGAVGEIEPGSTVFDDSALSSHSAALSERLAAGDIALSVAGRFE